MYKQKTSPKTTKDFEIFSEPQKFIQKLQEFVNDYLINSTNSNKQTILHLLCGDKVNLDVGAVDFLLDADADINFTDNMGNTPLHAVCGNPNKCSAEVTMLLLKNKAKVNIMNKDGKTPLHIYLLSKNINFEILKCMLEKVDKKIINDEMQISLFHLACQSGNNEIIKVLLEENGDKINTPDKNGKIPFAHACNNPHFNVETLNLFIKKGICNNEKESPLHWLFSSPTPDADLLETWINHEFKEVKQTNLSIFSISNSSDDKPTRKNIDKKFDTNGKNILHFACENGTEQHNKKIALLLNKCKPNSKDSQGNSPLHYACLNKNFGPENLKLLLQKKANPALKNANDITPFEFAIKADNILAIKIFLKNAMQTENHVDISFMLDKLVNYFYDCLLLDKTALIEELANTTTPYLKELLEKTAYKILNNSEEDKDKNLKPLKNLIKHGLDINLRNKNNELIFLNEIYRSNNFESLFKNTNELYRGGKTLLHLVCENKDSNQYDASFVIDLIIKKLKFNPALTDDYGKTPFHYAAENGNIELNMFFLENESTINLMASKDKSGKTPFDYAVESKNIHLVNLFLKKDEAFFNKRDDNGKTILHRHCENQSAEIGIIDFLISKCSVSSNLQDDNGKTCLHLAIENKNCSSQVIGLLLQKSENQTIPDKEMATALHSACRIYDGTIEMQSKIKKLLMFDFSILEEDNKMKNALHYLCESGFCEKIFFESVINNSIEFRKQKKINNENLDNEITTKLSDALNKKDETGKTPFHYACLQENPNKKFILLLLQKEADPTITYDEGKNKLIDYLLEKNKETLPNDKELEKISEEDATLAQLLRKYEMKLQEKTSSQSNANLMESFGIFSKPPEEKITNNNINHHQQNNEEKTTNNNDNQQNNERCILN